MAELGLCNTLTVLKASGTGYLLDAGPLGQAFLSGRQAQGCPAPGDELEVFLYLQADGALAATPRKPKIQRGEVALLRIADVNDTGAFLDWGLDKDLLLPFAEQIASPRSGQDVLVIAYLDKSRRLVASMKLDEFIEDQAPQLQAGQEVPIVIGNKTELGYKAVIDHQYWGLLYDNELFKPVKRGDRMSAWVKRRRDDGRIDLSLQPPGRQRVNALSGEILAALAANEGFLALGDKSPPEAIYRIFGVSKKAFKQTIGHLYKTGKIAIEERGIRLL